MHACRLPELLFGGLIILVILALRAGSRACWRASIPCSATAITGAEHGGAARGFATCVRFGA